MLYLTNIQALAGLNPCIQTIYMWLCHFANQKGECCPSRELLASVAGVNIKSVDRALTQLTQLRLIHTLKNKKTTNPYKILITNQDTQKNCSKGKKNTYTEQFETFWQSYPNKKNKFNSFKAWKRLSEKDKVDAIKALPKHKQQESWMKEGGQYVPMASTWLNGRRWEDEIALKSGYSAEYLLKKYNK